MQPLHKSTGAASSLATQCAQTCAETRRKTHPAPSTFESTVAPQCFQPLRACNTRNTEIEASLKLWRPQRSRRLFARAQNLTKKVSPADCWVAAILLCHIFPFDQLRKAREEQILRERTEHSTTSPQALADRRVTQRNNVAGQADRVANSLLIPFFSRQKQIYESKQLSAFRFLNGKVISNIHWNVTCPSRGSCFFPFGFPLRGAWCVLGHHQALLRGHTIFRGSWKKSEWNDGQHAPCRL